MSHNEENNINEQEQGSLKSVITAKLTNGKLVFLCIVGMALCTFLPLSIFAPLPLASAYLFYGRNKTASLVAAITAGLFGLSFVGGNQLLIIGIMFLIANVFAYCISTIITKNVHPAYGLIRNGLIISTLVITVTAGSLLMKEAPVVDQVEASLMQIVAVIKQSGEFKEMLSAGEERALVIEKLISNTKDVAKNIVEWSVSYIFVGVFFSLWLTLFMVLKNTMIWKELHNYQYGLKDLVNFKVPENFVYLLIASLGLLLGGEYLMGTTAEVIGGNILYMLSIFYFFQGFGIYIALLDYLRIDGFMRSTLVIITIFMAHQMVAIVGALDMWVNFRRFLKKKKSNEGDII
jgi:hypothetical protein